MTVEQLKGVLAAVEPGEVSDVGNLEQLIASCWDDLDGSGDGGMEGYKILDRMEQVYWEPPILRFTIERHGGTVKGSIRAELQYWEIDLDNRTAGVVKSGHRQLAPTAPRVSVKTVAHEIAEAILSGQEDDRIERSENGSVKVLTSKICPTNSGVKRTIQGRRKSLLNYISEKLDAHGWTRSGVHFVRSVKEGARNDGSDDGKASPQPGIA